MEDYHKTDLLRQEVIEAINDFGKRTPLFARSDAGRNNAFILLEGVTESIRMIWIATIVGMCS